MKTKLIATAVLAALVAQVACADKVTLKSGSVLIGDADILRDGKLAFKSADLGDLQIDVANIVKLESERDHVVQHLDNSRETKPVTVVDGTYALRSGEKLDMANVKAIDPDVEAWHGSVNLSATATRGNTVGESATAVANVSKRWEKDRVTANAGYYFAQSGDSKQDKQKTSNRFELEAQEDHFWSDRLYSYLNGKYEYDRIMLLKYRYRLGTGLGWQWLENRDFGFGKMSFNQEVGATYVAEKYDHADEDNYLAARYAHHLAWEVAAVPNLAFTHNLEYIPEIGDWANNYLLDTDVGLTYAFSANWQLLAKIEWDYKSKVGPSTKHSDLRYILGVGYVW